VTRERPTALLLDLDGVLRRFDPAVGAEVERRHGLPEGVLAETALRWPLLRAAVTGQISHEQWLDAVVDELAGAGAADGSGGVAEPGSADGSGGVGGPGDPLWAVRLDPVADHPAPQPEGGGAARTTGVTAARTAARTAVAEWAAYRGEVDPEVLAFVRELRAAGVPVGLATNATDALDADLAQLGLVGEVDVVVNSSVVGAHKPTVEYFQQACQAIGAPPSRVLFVDDTDRHVRGARVAGLAAYRWSGPADLRYLRAALAR